MAYLVDGDMENYQKANTAIMKVCEDFEPNTHFDFFQQKIKFSEEHFGKQTKETGFWYFVREQFHFYATQMDDCKAYALEAYQIFDNLEEMDVLFFRTCQLLADVETRFYDLESSEKYQIKSIEILNRLFETGKISEEEKDLHGASVNIGFGALCYYKRDFEGDIRHCQYALDTYLKYNKKEKIGGCYRSIGLANYYLTNYAKAKEYAQKGLYYEQQVVEVNSVKLVPFYSILSTIEIGRFDNVSAKKFLKKALALNLRHYGEAHFQSVHMYNKLGFIYGRMEQLDSAAFYLKKACDLWTTHFPKEYHLKIHTQQAYGIVLMAQDKPDAALEILQGSIEESRRIFGEKSHYTTTGLALVGEAYHDIEDFEKAMDSFQKSLLANTLNFDPNSPFIFPKANDFLSYGNGTFTLSRQIGLLEDYLLKEPDNIALSHQFQSATELYWRTSNERTKTNQKDDFLDSETITSRRRIGRAAVSQNAAFYKRRPKEDYLKKCFFWMEYTKSQELLFNSQESEAYKFAQIPPSLVQEEARLSQKIDSLDQNLFFRSLEKSREAAVLHLGACLPEFVMELTQHDRKMRCTRMEIQASKRKLISVHATFMQIEILQGACIKICRHA